MSVLSAEERWKRADKLFCNAGKADIDHHELYHEDTVITFCLKNWLNIELYKKKELIDFPNKNQRKSEKP